jgi:hypothetical protein
MSDHDSRILDPKNTGILGHTQTLDPGKVKTSEVGDFLVQRTFGGVSVVAINQANPSMITIAIEAQPIQSFNAAAFDGTPLVQAVIQFGSGSGELGMQPGIAVAGIAGPAESRILVDVETGIQLTLPASRVKIGFLYTAWCAAGAVAGNTLGPKYQVTWGMGYEPKASIQPITCTQYHNDASLINGERCAFYRPRYAKKIEFLWREYGSLGVIRSPLDVQFFSAIQTDVYDARYTVNNPPLLLPWPPDAVEVQGVNSSGGTMNILRAVSHLQF